MEHQDNVNAMLRKFANIRLSNASEDVLTLNNEIAQSSLNLGANCCYGKIYLAPYFNFRTLQTILDRSWNKTDFRVSKVRDGLLQFFFQSKDDMEVILERAPSNIDNHLLILIPNSTHQLSFPSDFEWIEYWIHFWGLPGFMISEKIGRLMLQCPSIKAIQNRAMVHIGQPYSSKNQHP